MPRPSSPKGGKSIIESALAPWIAERPDFLWIPTNPRTILLDRISGAIGEAKNGAVPSVAGPTNYVGNSLRHLEFNVPASYPNGLLAMVLLSVEDPTAMTGCFIKVGNDSYGLGLGAGNTTFEDTGSKRIGLVEGVAWRAGASSAFTKGLNVAALFVGNSNSSLNVVTNFEGEGTSGSWTASSNQIRVGGYVANRGANARVLAAAVYGQSRTNAEWATWYNSRVIEVRELLQTPHADVERLFRERSRRVWAVSGGGGLSLTGSLTGQGSTLSATATNTEVHALSGDLVGAGATLSGTATRIYSLTGSLTGQGATLSGSATTLESHAATGALVGAGSTLSATATNTEIHVATGALVGAGSALSATATNTEIHAATGALVGSGSTLSGSATHTPVGINASGSLVGQGATLSATATNTEVHTCTGALYGQGATLSGALTRVFSASGSLVGAGSTLSATAGNAVAVFSATGSLVGQGSTLTATATNTETHAVSGSLVGQGATLSATAALANLHTLSGSLVGSGSSLVGYASGPTTVFEASPDAIVTVINKRNRVSVISRRS